MLRKVLMVGSTAATAVVALAACTGAPQAAPPKAPPKAPTQDQSPTTPPTDQTGNGGQTGNGTGSGDGTGGGNGAGNGQGGGSNGQGGGTGSTGGTGGTGGGSAQTPECTLAHLRVSVHNGDAGSGHYGLALVFKHDDSGTCVMHGYPGVAGLDAHGNQVTQARRTLRGYLGGLQQPINTIPTIRLAPGATASAYVEGTNVPPGNATSCTVYKGLLVTPPDEAHSVRVDVTANGCDGLQIHPVVPGDTGDLTP
jgi:hypothetical protein